MQSPFRKALSQAVTFQRIRFVSHRNSPKSHPVTGSDNYRAGPPKLMSAAKSRYRTPRSTKRENSHKTTSQATSQAAPSQKPATMWSGQNQQIPMPWMFFPGSAPPPPPQFTPNGQSIPMPMPINMNMNMSMNMDNSFPNQQFNGQPPPPHKKPHKKKLLRAQQNTEMAQGKADDRPRAVPSAASGGVPEPSNSYMQQANGPPRALQDPRRILVIVDLNGTLLYRPNKKQPFTFQERPHAKKFLTYCINTFSVAIWSSARPLNVEKMVERLLEPELRSRCVVIWGRDKFGLSRDDFDSRVQCYKRLTRIWADPAVVASHPEANYGFAWDQTNTILVDDSKEKGRSEPYNILQIPEFFGASSETKDVLPQVHDYLNTICYQEDISRYVRENPFLLDDHYDLYRSSR